MFPFANKAAIIKRLARNKSKILLNYIVFWNTKSTIRVDVFCLNIFIDFTLHERETCFLNLWHRLVCTVLKNSNIVLICPRFRISSADKLANGEKEYFFTRSNFSTQGATGRTRLLGWGIPRPSGAMDGHRRVYTQTCTYTHLRNNHAEQLSLVVWSVAYWSTVLHFSLPFPSRLFPGCTGSNPSQVTF